MSTIKQKEKLEEIRRKEEDDDLTIAEISTKIKLQKSIAHRALLLSIAPSLETTEKEKRKLERRKKEEVKAVLEEPMTRPDKRIRKTF